MLSEKSQVQALDRTQALGERIGPGSLTATTLTREGLKDERDQGADATQPDFLEVIRPKRLWGAIAEQASHV